VADHPLRPATDRRLGEPLPHQLANRTRANPSAMNLSPRIKSAGVSGISSSFPELFRTKGYVPTRYSPVCRSPCGALDLHVLSLPPAFVLSQDQTLKLNLKISIPTGHSGLERLSTLRAPLDEFHTRAPPTSDAQPASRRSRRRHRHESAMVCRNVTVVKSSPDNPPPPPRPPEGRPDEHEKRRTQGLAPPTSLFLPMKLSNSVGTG
jgi:hypothetical protein